MRSLAISQMEGIEGGSLGCAAAIAGGALFVGSLFIAPVGAAAVAFYAVNTTVGPSVVGIGIGTACS